MKAATEPTTALKAIPATSPRVRWKTAAGTITTTRPAAASSMSQGLIRVAEGRTRLMAPRSSELPMKRTSPGGTAPGHTSCWASWAIGCVVFDTPANPKSTTCAVQSLTLRQRLAGAADGAKFVAFMHIVLVTTLVRTICNGVTY
jgi:hypothetical protein